MFTLVRPLALSALVAPAFAQPIGAEELQAASAAAAQARSRLSILEAQELLVGALSVACRDLEAVQTRADAAALAAEIEAALLELDVLFTINDDRPGQREMLRSVMLSPAYGSAFALLERMRGRELAALHPLVDWQFIGPFDNERGRGIRRTLEPEKRPGVDDVHAGKVREVVWRRTPTTPPARGAVTLGELLRPAEQVCVIARTWIESDEDREVLLCVGVEGELVAWINGEGVFETQKPHRFAPDSFVVPLKLRAGWNELALKVGNRDEALVFAARLAETESGRPLALTTSGELPAGQEPCELERRMPKVEPDGARPGLRAALAGSTQAEAQYRLALLERNHQSLPAAENPGRERARAAVEAEPLNLRYAILRVDSLVDDVRITAESDVNPWLHAVDALAAIDPRLPLAAYWRAQHELGTKECNPCALEWIERALVEAPEAILARDLRITILDREGQGSLAARDASRLLADPRISRYPLLLRQRVDASSLTPAQREALVDSLAERYRYDEFVIRRADLRRIRGTGGGSAGVHELLASRSAESPWSVAPRLDAAAALIHLGEADEALGILEEAEQLAPDELLVSYWRARAHLVRGDVEAAITALERELELDFAAADEERLLEHLRAEGAQAFHEPWREPLDAVLARAPLEAPAGASRHVLLSRLVVEVHPDGTAKRYRRLVQRVSAEQGARELDRIPFFAAADQDLRVLRADVRHADGTTEPARTGRGRFVYVDMPPLEVGDVVDVEWRVDDQQPTFFGNYFGLNESLTSDVRLAVAESDIVLLVPAELPLVFHTRAFAGEREERELADGRREYTFRMRDIPPLRPEALMPGAEEFAPLVQASSYADWDAFGRWWWNLIEQEIRVSPEMREKVAALTANASTPEEKLRAIYEFVVTDIRYNAWEFGVRGYQPYSAPVIFSRGFGDCKDKAILMRALLSEVGIEAYPTLIRAEDRRPDEDQTLALVEHFNHCIAFVPEQDGVAARFLDGTARHHPFGILPAMDHGAEVLVVQPDGVRRMEIPFAQAQENRIEREITARFDSELGMTVAVERRATGIGDPRERARFSGGEEERREQAEAMFAETFGAAVGPIEWETSDLEDLSTPPRVVLRGRPERLGRPIEGGFEFPVTLQPLELLRGIASEARRERDLLLDVPRSSAITLVYDLGPGARARVLPAPVDVENEDVHYSFRAEETDGGVRIVEEFRLSTQRIPPERYAAFREACRAIDEAQAKKIELEIAR